MLTFRCSTLLYILFLVSLLDLSSIHSITAVGLPINVWPNPTTFNWTHPESVPLSPSFTITSPYHKYLTPAVSRYLRQILKEHHTPLITPSVNSPSSFPLKSLRISVLDISAPLTHGVSESYNLTVPGAGAGGVTAVMTAATPWAAMRGLETFSQLVWGNPGRVGSGLFISDTPLFGHRGVLLDTSRNFFSVDDILRLIKGMSMNKLNVFHWHITDSHSFPIMVPSEPMLSEKGSYGGDMVYTPEHVKRVVEFGFQHGVRVLPEIDMPGHTGSWAEAYPEIVACAKMFWWPAGSGWADRLASEPGTGQLNPLNPKTYEVLKNVIRDVIAMFPEPFFHAGSDEIVPGCWKVDKTIQTFLANNGTLSQVLEIFVNTTNPYIVSQNRTVVYWEDVMLDDAVKVDPAYLPKETTILQTWNNGPNNTKRIVNAGYRAIVSSSDFYYLDCGHGGFVGNDSQYAQKPGTDQGKGGSWCAPFKTWQTIYNYDITYGLNKEQAKLVLGGEVALWTEQADPTVLDSRVWPRASAMAEALWSGNVNESGMKRYAEATDRLIEWRHRMVNRGIGAEAIQPLWCIRNPTMCNTVQDV
ncbi:Beta-hexosaminidase [Heracleum sosnowskyi]|uniref:Beta-hexosaminidase n=1 Tax=Heracleum sosnowskyi TaxID=360622 RepID=A0AAD8N9X0_9APIA|nr:Beta-hexosaminidase [Heracleum sosnowskyi]